MVTMRDVLSASYTTLEKPTPMTKANTALLLVDLQELATPEHLASKAVAAGLESKAVDLALADYSERFYAALGNCSRLLTAAREVGVPCIHVKIESLAGNARDTGPAHRRLGWCYPPGSKETRFLAQTSPAAGEIIITKTVSGAFTATNLDSVLRHMGIEWLVIAGFETDECIEASGRSALDLGYLALFAEDGCTAYEASSHDNYMSKYMDWGLTRSTTELVASFSSLD